MKETTVEVEEKEVEQIYCDKCGTECTDDYKVEPRHVCRSCSDESAVERVTDLLRPSEDEDLSVFEVLFSTLISPFILLVLITVMMDEEDWNPLKQIIVLSGGSILWTAGILILLL